MAVRIIRRRVSVKSTATRTASGVRVVTRVSNGSTTRTTTKHIPLRLTKRR